MNDSARAVFQYLKANGLSDHAAAGVVGNLIQESSLDPGNINDGEGSYGLAQWRGDRREALKRHAGPGNEANPNAQMSFLLHEARQMPGFVDRLNASPSATHAAMLFGKEFERPKTVEPIRGQYAEQVLAGGSGSDTVKTGSSRVVWGTSGDAPGPAAAAPSGGSTRIIWGTDAASPQEAPAPPQTPIGAAPTGPAPSFMDRVGMGVGDVWAALNQKGFAAERALKNATGIDIPESSPGIRDSYDQQLQQREAAYQASRGKGAGIDWGRLAGSTLALSPLAALPGAQGIAGAAALGAASGLAEPQTGGEYSGIDDLKNAGFGAVASVLTAGALRGLGRAVGGLTPDQNAKALLDRGITPTPGQVLGGTARAVEDKITSIPVLGDTVAAARRRGLNELNTAAANDALSSIGEKATAAPGRNLIAEVKARVQGAYNDLLPRIQFAPDQQWATEVRNVIDMAQDLPAAQAQQFRGILQNRLFDRMGAAGRMSGEAFKEAESALGRLAKNYRSSADGDQRIMGDALQEVLRLSRNALERVNPDYADELRAVNQAWSKYLVIRDAAGMTGAVDGMFTPAQLTAAVKRNDWTKGKDAFARGRANMQDLSDAAKAVMPSVYPDSGTAGRLMQMNLPALALGAASALPATIYTSPVMPRVVGALVNRPGMMQAAGQGIERAVPLSALIGGELVSKP